MKLKNFYQRKLEVEFAPQDTRLVNGAYWLIRLRWIAIAWVCLAAFIARYIFNISVQDVAFYCSGGALLIENTLSLILLKRLLRTRKGNIFNYVRKIINFQISFDLLVLTIIIHYSGGIENPIFIFYIFHIVIASILLSKLDSYIQTTFAIILLCLLALFEYSGIIPHYDLWLERAIKSNLFCDTSFILEILTIFIITAYFLVYMANYVVTLLRKQEKAYEQANIQLQQQDAIKNEYVLRVTHNIKGHLAAIQTSLAVLNDKILGPIKDKQYEFIKRAYTRTIKLTEFVNTLLKLTQMRLDDKLEPSIFSIRDTIHNAITTVKKDAANESITLNSNIAHTIDKITSNPFSIEEVIVNLLHNAIKYTPSNGTIDVNVKDHKDNILIEISDTGIGIPQEELPKVFDEFYRASNAKKLVKDGTGLGLSMVKQIIQRYGGKIWVNSREGIGSKFSFTLPKSISTSNN